MTSITNVTEIKQYVQTNPDLCGKCKGDGQVWVPGTKLHNFDDSHFEKCPLCEGSGMITVTRETVVTIKPLIPCWQG